MGIGERRRKQRWRGHTPSYIATHNCHTGQEDGEGGSVGQHQAGQGHAPPSFFGGTPAALLPLHTWWSVSWTSSVVFSSCCFDSTRETVHTGQGPSTHDHLSPSLPLPDVLSTHQLASGGRPCTRQAAGLGDKEWLVGQRWLVAGGEDVDRASTCEWSVRRNRRRVHLLDQCSPQICPHPHHTGTVAEQEGRLTCKGHQNTFGSWILTQDTRGHCAGHMTWLCT